MQIFGKYCSLNSVDQLLSSLDKLDHIQWLVHYPLFFFLLIQFSPLVMLTLVCTNCRLRRASFIVTIVGSVGLWASLTDGLPSLCLVSFIIILTYNIGYRIGGHENYFHCKRCGMHFFMIKLLPRTNCKIHNHIWQKRSSRLSFLYPTDETVSTDVNCFLMNYDLWMFYVISFSLSSSLFIFLVL